MDMISTIKGTLFEQLYPAGWDLERLKYCVTREADTICDRQDFWHKDFQPEPVEDLQSMAVQFGHEIAMQIKKAKEEDVYKRQHLPLFKTIYFPAAPVL